MTLNIDFIMKLPLKLEKKGEWFISSCPIIDVYSQGKTAKEAKENIIDAVSLFFLSCFERGTLDAVFKECGFRPLMKKRITKPLKEPENYINVSIPFEVNTKHAQCRA